LWITIVNERRDEAMGPDEGSAESSAAFLPPYVTGQAASQGAAADEQEGAPAKIEAQKAGSRLSASPLSLLDRGRINDGCDEETGNCP
jgi:hypothetical protein